MNLEENMTSSKSKVTGHGKSLEKGTTKPRQATSKSCKTVTSHKQPSEHGVRLNTCLGGGDVGDAQGFDPHPQRLTIFHVLRSRRRDPYDSLVKSLILLTKGVKVLEIDCIGCGLCPDQVLLINNFCLRPDCRQKSLVGNSGVGGGGRNVLLKHPPCPLTLDG